MRPSDDSRILILDPASRLLLRTFFRQWYRENGRWFPWREPDVSPYGILIAEMLLRQTRADTVASIWPVFMQRFPTPRACLEASFDDLNGLVAGLGLGNQRVEALQSAATALVSQYGGNVPRSITSLAAIPHLGLYSAHTIACFAYNRRVPVVDVNILRLFSRLIGEDFGQDNRRGRAPEAWQLARDILPSRGVKEHNYGLLDFCGQICRPRHPAHSDCPLSTACAYFQEHVVGATGITA